ncbi:MAG TPA: sigma-54 dependent transcriptional regulator [Planctomycetota bacterium]|nr:sigma-54 dependent transcriptional regulator [Planctomycetota bacterium]
MSGASISVLVVDDDEQLLEFSSEALRSGGYQVRSFSNPVLALASFTETPTELVFTDLQMPGMGGIDLLRKIKEIRPATPVILASGFGTVKNAVQAMKDGAFDFITKPFDVEHLLELVKRALELRSLRQENAILRAEVSDLRGSRIAPMGSSAVMKKLLEMARSVAATDATVLITGESGVGKEVLADFVQRNSPRKDGPFVKVNCGALSGTLLESELFGHEKGAFTGATERRTGRFEQSQKGTIFLDEIGELSMEAQTRLLRVLQQREVQRVGGTTTINLDIRVICATNKDLKAEVAARRFREDLFYRINVFPLNLPPLRQRISDIPALCLDLLRQIRQTIGRGPSDISQAALDKLATYAWPGNIRELENVLQRCSILSSQPVLDVGDLPDEISSGRELSLNSSAAEPDAQPAVTLDEARGRSERERILAALQECRWHISNTAKRLGISRATLYVKMEQYKIEH